MHREQIQFDADESHVNYDRSPDRINFTRNLMYYGNKLYLFGSTAIDDSVTCTGFDDCIVYNLNTCIWTVKRVQKDLDCMIAARRDHVFINLALVYMCLQSFASKDKTIGLLSVANILMLNRLNHIQSI